MTNRIEKINEGYNDGISVSTNQNPIFYFKSVKKMLETREEVVLSALEGAIIMAVDSALLLERSKIAKITNLLTDLTRTGQTSLNQNIDYLSSHHKAIMKITVVKTAQYEEFLISEKLNGISKLSSEQETENDLRILETGEYEKKTPRT
mmetsp:Transcript_15588/g.23224  ORF Transcript_15588/g.23224 Transcript_15588/m.23224 type:complete len:149 (-) Transcript_15588:149-595(-)